MPFPSPPSGTGCSVETCQRPGRVVVDRDQRFLLCNECYQCVLYGHPYFVRILWSDANTIERIIAVSPSSPPGPSVVEVV
jgi:hypothetical protein